MNVAFVIYDGMTALDFVGAFDPITRLGTMGFMDIAWDVCARTETVEAAGGLGFTVDRVSPDLGEYDLLFVPGGFVARDLRDDDDFIQWIRSADAADYKTSVCTGSLILGGAGYLQGKRATTHPSAYELLAEYCDVVDERVVHDGNVITGRGVSSSIDLGLYVVEELSDRETREQIQRQMDYPYGEHLHDRPTSP